MGTRSGIGIKNENGTVTGVYCHWDGYPSHNGRILVQYYHDESKIREMISHGDMSVLGKVPGSKTDFDAHHPSEDGVTLQCVYYGRDRGETDVETRTFKDEKDFRSSLTDQGAEYTYLFENGSWYARGYGKPVSLEKYEDKKYADFEDVDEVVPAGLITNQTGTDNA